MTTLSLLITTLPSEEVAHGIARQLVNEGLAACVSLIPHVQSFYQWEGNIEQNVEVLMILKVVSTNLKKAREHLTACHPYDVPLLVELKPENLNSAYLEWALAQGLSG